MASLKYLWLNRRKVDFRDKQFFVIWAKRLLSLKDVISRDVRRKRLIRGGATISSTAEVGVAQFDGKLTHLIVGDNSFIGRAKIALLDEVIIGKNVCINDGVVVLTASHDLNDPHWQHKKAAVQIDDYAWIATEALLLPGVHIGRGAVVGARAVVSKDVAPYTIVTGNPAKPIPKNRTSTLAYNPTEFLAADVAWLKG
jgi:maltose O-acetyltransferase